ncbi:hypothetical protein JVX92_15130 (plasmid) [Microbacterium hominis]|uniref:hypothetical protein n=1 Tax=Microbacterium hominis TaxID=162426 RepID=UPI00196688C8|nr:hypothetical protein [Microbacterium hominis]QRY42313.1 hypothetical protein JVX92_15130 [Microbacterium hominis]
MIDVVPLVARVAVPVLSRVATRVANGPLLQFRVQFAVRRRTGFFFPGGPFRDWLRRECRAGLRFPPEQAAAELAQSLDRVLGARFRWAVQLDRMSKALRIVEAVYDAMLLLSREPEARSLQASWDGHRHAEIVALLTKITGSFSGFSREDEATVLRIRSATRSSTRLAAFKVDRAVVASSLSRMTVPAVAIGQVRVLVGAFGSGKSEAAERWHLERIEAAAESPDAPHAVWMDAADLSHQTVEAALGSMIPVDTWRADGVALVIDGLDETDTARASQLLVQARGLVSSNAKSCALLTSRPGVLDTEDVAVPWNGLDPSDAEQLVESVAGSQHVTWSWSSSLRDAITRPFFALAAGVLIAQGQRPNGQADLIRRLVEHALSDLPTSAAAVTASDRYQALRSLAENLTHTANVSDGLTFQQRALVRETSLIHDRRDGSVEFTLPIFQQWFAAQSILEDSSAVAELCAAPQSFDRWRWTIAVACAAGDAEKVDAIIADCLRGNPGAGAWVVDQVSAGHGYDLDSSEPLDASTAGSRLLRATRAMVTAMGAMASSLFPVESADQPIVLGVRVDGPRLTNAWSLQRSTSDVVLELPDEVHPFNSRADGWVASRSGLVPEGVEWPWRLVQDHISGGFDRVLASDPQMGPRFGVWHVESMYRAARILLNQSDPWFRPMPVSAIVAAAEQLLRQVPNASDARFNLNTRLVHGRVLVDLVDWLSEADGDELRRPLPTPDLDPQSRWIWSVYSDKQLQKFHAEAFGLACEAYDEAVQTCFSSFGWTMSTGADGDFGVIGQIDFYEDPSDGARSPAFASARAPLSTIHLLTERLKDEDPVLASNGRALFTVASDDGAEDWVRSTVNQQRAAPSRSTPFSVRGTYSHSMALDTTASRVATQIAAEWLFDDLKALGLAKGTGPRFDR